MYHASSSFKRVKSDDFLEKRIKSFIKTDYIAIIR